MRSPRPPRAAEAITAGLLKQIAEGVLKGGDKLLPERDMAKRLKVSRVTVREAYRALEREGYVTIRRGAGGGATVVDRVPSDVQSLLPLLLAMLRLNAAA